MWAGLLSCILVTGARVTHRSPQPCLPLHPTPQQHPLPETSLLSKGGGKPWAFRSDWSPHDAGRGGDWLPGVVSRRGQSPRRGSATWLSCSGCRRGCSAGAAERARAGATTASAAVHRALLPPRGFQEAAGRGGRASGARGGGGGGEVMLAPGIRAAAAENKHLRDPGCSVPVVRGPAERPETARPAGKVRLSRSLCDLGVLTRT